MIVFKNTEEYFEGCGGVRNVEYEISLEDNDLYDMFKHCLDFLEEAGFCFEKDNIYDAMVVAHDRSKSKIVKEITGE